MYVGGFLEHVAFEMEVPVECLGHLPLLAAQGDGGLECGFQVAVAHLGTYGLQVSLIADATVPLGADGSVAYYDLLEIGRYLDFDAHGFSSCGFSGSPRRGGSCSRRGGAARAGRRERWQGCPAG